MSKVRKDTGPIPALRQLKILCDQQSSVIEQILAWAGDGQHSNAEIRAGIASEWQIVLSADSKVSELLSWWRLKSRYASAGARVEQIEKMLLEKSIPADKVREIGQTIFTIEAVESGDSKDFVNLESLRLAQDSARAKFALEKEKLKLADRRVKVAERKLDQLKGALTDGELSDGQRVQRMKQVFGIA